MKKISILALTLVLTAALFAGCRNRNQPMEPSKPSTTPTTQETTVPTTAPTQPTVTDTMPSETVDHGNGPIEGTEDRNGTTGTESTVEGRTVNPTSRAK